MAFGARQILRPDSDPKNDNQNVNNTINDALTGWIRSLVPAEVLAQIDEEPPIEIEVKQAE